MAFSNYRAEDGWSYIDGPSGKGGHALTARGLDGVAYNRNTRKIEIVEQKGINDRRRIGLKDRPTAVTRNLRTNLDDLIELLEAQPAFPDHAHVLAALRQTRRALDKTADVPPNVAIVITSARATGLTDGVRHYWEKKGVDLPVRFESTAARTPET